MCILAYTKSHLKMELRKQKHFEERSWKRKQTRKRLTLYETGSGSKKYSTASTSLRQNIILQKGEIYYKNI